MHIISRLVCEWYGQHKRNLPWRETTDAYRIWLSEVILQQTRVVQGTDYYYRFIDAFPSVIHLALAHEDEVLKLWQGLGYYSRARNLHKTAKIICNEYGGIFPNSHKQLLALPGVGKYTAAAIASFAFAMPIPVLDGNVFRVLARLFGIEQAIDIQANVKLFDQILFDLIIETDPAIFNQSMMEFGALQCVPQNPSCNHCPLMHHCIAFQKGIVAQLPFKSKEIVQRVRYFNYIFVIHNDNTFLRQRMQKDIWQNLYEPILFETEAEISGTELEMSNDFTQLFAHTTYKMTTLSKRKHILTHQKIFAQMFVLNVNNKNFSLAEYKEIRLDELHTFAIPRLVDLFLNDLKSYTYT